MLRFIFTMFVYVLIARWLYSEIALFVPRAAPAIDVALSYIEIPTHDKWHKDGLNGLARGFVDFVRSTTSTDTGIEAPKFVKARFVRDTRTGHESYL